MPINQERYKDIVTELQPRKVELVAVSKLQAVADLQKLYDLGQRDFGENYVQELVAKHEALPKDIRWHFIGHLQKNKVKYIAPFVHLIHGVDSLDLLKEINKQARKVGRKIPCLLQVHIAQEETKFGLNDQELEAAVKEFTTNPEAFSNIVIQGLMGMASFSDDLEKVRAEMKSLKLLFDKHNNPEAAQPPLSPQQSLTTQPQQPTDNLQLTTLSMGMSGDYKIAIEEGSTMVRIGSLLFGARPSK